MNTSEALTLANDLMDKHGLTSKGWTFQYDNAKVRFGCTKYARKQITISRELTLLNDLSEVQDTILHEIAHALVGKGNGHNRIWKYKAYTIGAKPQRCYSSAVTTPKPKWVGTCPSGHETLRMKRMNLSCSRCSPQWNPAYKFVWSLYEAV
jgi:predicted SprT family Zn-dependent metalloprotease